MTRAFIIALTAILAFTLPMSHGCSADEEETRVQLSRPPLYDLTADRNDAHQLVDGQIVDGTMWLSRKAVGWIADGRPISITLHYPTGRIADRICLHLGERASAGALLPQSIDVFGNAGEAGEMRWLGSAHPPGPVTADSATYRVYEACIPIASTRLDAVEIVVAPRGAYFFIDEITVGASHAASRVRAPTSQSSAIADPLAFALRRNDLLSHLREAIRADAQAKDGLPGRLLAAADAGEALRDSVELDEAARALGRWRVRKQAANAPRFNLSAVDPFAPGASLDRPAPLEEPDLLVLSGQTEFAAASLIPVDARSGPFEINFAVLGAPQHAFAIELSTPVDVLTVQAGTAADALRPITKPIEVPTGLQQMVWAAVHAAPDAPAGTFPAKLTVRDTATGATRSITWTLRSEHFTPPRSAFASVVWSYPDRAPFARAPQRAIQDLRDHGVTVGVLPASLAPWPVAKDGRSSAPDYRAFDRALDASAADQRILLFLGFKGADFATGQRLGTPTPPLGPEWNRRFVAWIAAWTAHMKARGFGPERVAFYPVDEPGTPEQRAIFVRLSKLIRQAAPGWSIYTTLREVKGIEPDFVAAADIIQLDEATFDPDFSRTLLGSGKETWLYTAEGTGKGADPAIVYRALPWRAIAAGLSGAGAWSYSQNGDEGSPWDDLDGAERDRAMVYPASNGSWLSSRRWEAWRLGNQDAALLQAALERATTSAQRTRIRQLAAAGVAAQHSPAKLVAIRSELLALAHSPCC